MTLTEILTQIYDRFGIRATVPTEVSRRITGFVNETHNEILGQKGFQRLRRRTLSFSTVAGSSFAVLPQCVDKLYGIADRTNRIPLQELDPQDIWWGDPALASTGANPVGYALMDEHFPTAKEPSDASELFVKSSSASDTTQTAYIEGITSDGNLRTASAALNGTTAVSFGVTITTWISITKFYLSAAGAGVVSVYEDSGAGTLLGSIGITRTAAKYSRIQFWPPTSSAMMLYADVDIAMLDLINGTDEPFLPYKFHWLLVAGGMKKEYEKREKLSAMTAQEQRMAKGVARCRTFINKKQGIGSPVTRRGPMVPLLPGEVVTG